MIMTPTELVLLGTVCGWVAFDVYIYARKGLDQTISVVLWQLALRFPILPLGVGILIGHLWVPIVGICGK